MKLICYLLFVLALCLPFCKEGTADNSRVSSAQFDTLSNVNSTIPTIWNILCDIKGFEIISYCNSKNQYAEYYEVELMHDPFKPTVIISLLVKYKHIEKIYITRIDLSTKYSEHLRKKYEGYYLINLRPSQPVLHCFYDAPKEVDLSKRMTEKNTLKLDLFFTQTIWLMPEINSTKTYLDPETWNVRAIKDQVQKKIVRQDWEDEIYYENIQVLLNLCKITDYQYKKDSTPKVVPVK